MIEQGGTAVDGAIRPSGSGRRIRPAVAAVLALALAPSLSGCMFAEQPAPQYQVSLGQVGGEAVFQLCEDLAFDSLEFLQRYQNDDWEYVWEYSGSTVFLSAGTLVDSALASELGFDTSGVPRVVNSDGSFGIIAFSGDDVVLDAYFQPSATLSPSREWVRGDDSVGPDPCIDPDAQE